MVRMDTVGYFPLHPLHTSSRNPWCCSWCKHLLIPKLDLLHCFLGVLKILIDGKISNRTMQTCHGDCIYNTFQSLFNFKPHYFLKVSTITFTWHLYKKKAMYKLITKAYMPWLAWKWLIFNLLHIALLASTGTEIACAQGSLPEMPKSICWLASSAGLHTTRMEKIPILKACHQ